MAIPNFKNMRVLITGAGSGIGRACALSFARRSASLVLSDINADALKALKAEVEALGASCLALTCDVADEAAVTAFAKAVLEKVGAIDVLVNNAGIGYLGDFMSTDMAAWRRVIDINVFGIVHMTRAFLPAMRASGGAGAIVNVASTAGFAPAPNMAPYAASKHAVVGLSEVLAMELAGSQITVTIAAPGIINTNIVKVRSNIAPGVSEGQVRRIQAYYDKFGCDPSVVSEDIVRGVQSGKAVVETGPYAKLLCTVMRISRRLARRTTLSSSKKLGFI